jgi:site-specific recombinase XerD
MIPYPRPEESGHNNRGKLVDMPQGRGLLQVMRERIRLRRLSRNTEVAYLGWVRRYVAFHQRRHPREMGHAEITAFLTDLAINRQVSASTQNQALQALLFLYRQVLNIDVQWLTDVVRARKPRRVPVVLSRDEVRV